MNRKLVKVTVDLGHTGVFFLIRKITLFEPLSRPIQVTKYYAK